MEYDKLRIMPLGAGLEVGRSCVVLQYKGKNIMFDCGLHPAHTGFHSLPFFDSIQTQFNTQYIDLLLVTHFHLDHCGALPYFMENTNFKIGKTYMTHPTRAIYKLMLSDYEKVSVSDKKLFDKNALDCSMKKIDLIDYHQNLEFNGIKFTCYNAGHVLGAAMFLIEIDGVKILYTGDYSREEDKHIQPAEIPNIQIDVLIVESTFGVRDHFPRSVRENMFTDFVSKIVKSGGKCLLPVFVTGRAQELLLILDEYWSNNDDVQDIPIYYASSLAAKCMTVFHTYINMMGNYAKQKFKEGINPFESRYIRTLDNIEFDDSGALVLMASPGMLQNGVSREYFEKWCCDSRNGVCITGYCVEGTLSKIILNEPKVVQKLDGTTINLNMQIKNVAFCAHADCSQTIDYITKLKPANVMLVHGEENEAKRLQDKLQKTFQGMRVDAPSNLTEVVYEFEPRKDCQVCGELSNEIKKRVKDLLDEKMDEGKPQEVSVPISGVIVNKNKQTYLMKEDDLEDYLNIPKGKIMQKVMIPYNASLRLAHFFAEMIFEDVVLNEAGTLLTVNQEVVVTKLNEKTMLLEWQAGRKNDIIADNLGFLYSQIPEDPECDIFGAEKENLVKRQLFVLKNIFPNHTIDEKQNLIKFSDLNAQATLRVSNNRILVECDLTELRAKVEAILNEVESHSMK